MLYEDIARKLRGEEHTVTFNSSDPDIVMSDNITLIYGTELSENLPELPKKLGYTGTWTVNGETIPENYIVESDITITAVYTINKYTVTFETSETGVTMPENLTLDYGTNLLGKLPDVPEKKGYTGKWTIGGEEISADYTIEENVTVTAVYTINRYTVTFETATDGVTMPEKLTLDYGTNLFENLPTVPEKIGYTGKWTIDGNEISADYVIEDNVTVTAVYTINRYTVTFETDETGVTMPESLTLDYGTTLLGKLPAVPDKTGYTGKWTIEGEEISADYVVEDNIIVTAVYTINRYTVTFETDETGVTMPENLTLDYGTTLLDKLPDVPEKKGYTGKWTIEGEEISADYVVEDNVTVTAVYTINKYTVTFETDETGVTMPESLTINYGTNLLDKLPDVPEKTGYTGKWTIDGEEISADYLVENDVTVTAVYTINRYTVTFETAEDDVTMPENLTLDYGTNLFDNLPAIPEKTGYTGKWTIDGKEISADYVVEDDVTVTAVYTINNYTVTFESEETNVTMPERLTLDYGTNLFENLPTVPEKTGYTGKWTINGKEISADYVVEDDITVTAVYTINKYTVTFETDETGVTMPENLTLDYGTNLFENLPTVPEKIGYTGKWTINGAEISADYLVENDVTVTAVYTVNRYTVTFETEADGVTMPENFTLDYGTNLFDNLPAIPEKTGYTGKWTIDGEEISADYVVEDNVTVTAVYIINRYTVTFETATDGVTMPESLTLDYGTKLLEKLGNVPEKTGYTGKWTIDGNEISADYVVENDVIVTAVYTINHYTVTFTTSETGVTMPENLTLDYGTNLFDNLPAIPEKTGYTGKWTINGKEISADYVVEDDVTVTAVYTINNYTVTFESEETNVTMPESLTLDYGTNLIGKLPDVPEKKGYTGKWTINGEEISVDYLVENDVTVTAVYTINKYTVTFETDETGVTMPEDLTLDYGTNLLGKLPAVPDKTGYTGKWTIDGEEISADYTIEENVTVTAVYTINRYTVTFETATDGVTMPENLTLDYGTNLFENLPTVPEKIGYTGKWTINGAEISADYLVENDVTVTAVYTINKYTVTFETDETDVTMPERLTLDYGTNLFENLPTVPEKTGYTGKWTIDGEEISADYVVEDNVTVTAVYTINRYTVTFETSEAGVTMPENLTLDYGTNLFDNLPAIPEKTGYTGKWTIDGEEISADYVVEDNVTVTAVYTVNRYTVTFETDETGVTMPENLTLEYGANLLENLQNVEVPKKAFYTGKWTIDGAEVPADKTVDDDITITAVYTHIKVNVSFEYVGGYSDNEGVDLQNFVLKNLAELSFDHDISAEEFYKSISEYLSQVTDYTVAKTVYLKPSEMPQNILDISTLSEFTASTLLSDCAEDIVIDGEEVSQLTICFLPEWTVHTVTFDGTEEFKILDGMSFAALGIEMPTAPDGSVWIYWTANQAYYEFYEQTDITDDTAVYSGYAVSSYGYSNGSWQTDNLFGMIYKKAGDTLTDADLSALTTDGIIAGFISSPVTDPSEISGFVEAGTIINKNTDLYAVKGKFDYTDANGEKGTVYWLGDGFSLDMLPNVEEVGYKWHFDNEAGEEFNEETFWAKYDELLNNNSPYNAARFTIVAVKAYDHTVTYQSSDGSETVYYFNEGETLSENSRYTYENLPSGRLIYDTEGAEEGAYPQYDFLGWDIEINSDYVIYEGIELTIKVRTLTSYDESKIIMKVGDVIPKETIEAMEANAGRKFIAYNKAWNYATSEAPQGEMNELYLLTDPIQGNVNGMLEIYLLTHVFQYTTPNGDTVYLAVDTFISDKFMENVVGHDYGLTGTWYYKKEEEWIEITEDLTISSVFPDPCLVEVKLEPNV